MDTRSLQQAALNAQALANQQGVYIPTYGPQPHVLYGGYADMTYPALGWMAPLLPLLQQAWSQPVSAPGAGAPAAQTATPQPATTPARPAQGSASPRPSPPLTPAHQPRQQPQQAAPTQPEPVPQPTQPQEEPLFSFPQWFESLFQPRVPAIYDEYVNPEPAPQPTQLQQQVTAALGGAGAAAAAMPSFFDWLRGPSTSVEAQVVEPPALPSAPAGKPSVASSPTPPALPPSAPEGPVTPRPLAPSGGVGAAATPPALPPGEMPLSETIAAGPERLALQAAEAAGRLNFGDPNFYARNYSLAEIVKMFGNSAANMLGRVGNVLGAVSLPLMAYDIAEQIQNPQPLPNGYILGTNNIPVPGNL